MLISRRELLSSVVAVAASAALPDLSFAQARDSGLRINADRLRHRLEGLSVFGRPAGGTFSGGVNRVAFTDADVAGRNYAMQLMGAFGMEPQIDPAGNIFGLRSGSDQNLKPILFGSHIDSVPSGGNFDGDLGSMSAIEVMHTLKEHGVTTRHPLQMVIWTDEENTFAGSGSAAGMLQPSDLAAANCLADSPGGACLEDIPRFQRRFPCRPSKLVFEASLFGQVLLNRGAVKEVP